MTANSNTKARVLLWADIVFIIIQPAIALAAFKQFHIVFAILCLSAVLLLGTVLWAAITLRGRAKLRILSFLLVFTYLVLGIYNLVGFMTYSDWPSKREPGVREAN